MFRQRSSTAVECISDSYHWTENCSAIEMTLTTLDHVRNNDVQWTKRKLQWVDCIWDWRLVIAIAGENTKKFAEKMQMMLKCRFLSSIYKPSETGSAWKSLLFSILRPLSAKTMVDMFCTTWWLTRVAIDKMRYCEIAAMLHDLYCGAYNVSPLPTTLFRECEKFLAYWMPNQVEIFHPCNVRRN